jgi:hypothetical protein
VKTASKDTVQPGTALAKASRDPRMRPLTRDYMLIAAIIGTAVLILRLLYLQ